MSGLQMTNNISFNCKYKQIRLQSKQNKYAAQLKSSLFVCLTQVISITSSVTLLGYFQTIPVRVQTIPRFALSNSKAWGWSVLF